MEENYYVCEECGFRSDRTKICCGKRMVNAKFVTKTASNMCGCGCAGDRNLSTRRRSKAS